MIDWSHFFDLWCVTNRLDKTGTLEFYTDPGACSRSSEKWLCSNKLWRGSQQDFLWEMVETESLKMFPSSLLQVIGRKKLILLKMERIYKKQVCKVNRNQEIGLGHLRLRYIKAHMIIFGHFESEGTWQLGIYMWSSEKTAQLEIEIWLTSTYRLYFNTWHWLKLPESAYSESREGLQRPCPR